jgi:hypothetical protein
LFAPILAHEVGHTSWRQGVRAQLDSAVDLAAIEEVLRKAVPFGADPNELAIGFDSWRQELMCDALAATLTGPSFLFASTVFLPAPAEGKLGSHPYPRDRIAFTLRILEVHGWIPVLERLVPEVLGWCRGLGNDPILDGSAFEKALREAVALIEPAMIRVSSEVAHNRVTTEAFLSSEAELFDCLNLEIPPVLANGQAASPWLIISAGWLHELNQRGADSIRSLPTIASDQRLNRFLLKSVELSGVLRLWGSYDPTAP